MFCHFKQLMSMAVLSCFDGKITTESQFFVLKSVLIFFRRWYQSFHLTSNTRYLVKNFFHSVTQTILQLFDFKFNWTNPRFTLFSFRSGNNRIEFFLFPSIHVSSKYQADWLRNRKSQLSTSLICNLKFAPRYFYSKDGSYNSFK